MATVVADAMTDARSDIPRSTASDKAAAALPDDEERPSQEAHDRHAGDSIRPDRDRRLVSLGLSEHLRTPAPSARLLLRLTASTSTIGALVTSDVSLSTSRKETSGPADQQKLFVCCRIPTSREVRTFPAVFPPDPNQERPYVTPSDAGSGNVSFRRNQTLALRARRGRNGSGAEIQTDPSPEFCQHRNASFAISNCVSSGSKIVGD